MAKPRTPHHPIPRQLQHLERYGDIPVPFTVQWSDGKPDFRKVDPEKIARCARRRLCGVCGMAMLPGETYAFLGGPGTASTLIYTDPWMHIECARFSAKACTHLNGTRPTYRGELHNAPVELMPPTQHVFLVTTKKAGYVPLSSSTKLKVFRAYEPVTREMLR